MLTCVSKISNYHTRSLPAAVIYDCYIIRPYNEGRGAQQFQCGIHEVVLMVGTYR